jgi:hypothetical protein
MSLKTDAFDNTQTSSAGEAHFLFCEKILRSSWQGYQSFGMKSFRPPSLIHFFLTACTQQSFRHFQRFKDHSWACV